MILFLPHEVKTGVLGKPRDSPLSRLFSQLLRPSIPGILLIEGHR